VAELTQAWEAIIEDEAKRVPETAVAVADDLRGVLNTRKNAQGQLAGLARGHLVDNQRAMEERVKQFARAHAEFAPSLEAFDALTASMNERLATWDRDFLLDWSVRGARALTWPLSVVRKSVEFQKPDAEREPGWQDRDLPRLRERLERDQKRYAPAVDQRLFASWVRRALTLPKEQRLASIDAVFKNPAEVEQTIAQLARSKIFDPASRKQMLEETPEQLKARHDPLIDLALALDADRRELRDRRDGLSGRALRLRPQWRKAVAAEAKKPLAPDANSTLRVTFGIVKGYSPRDAIDYQPQTTLAGLLQKHTGAEPFDVPQKVRDAAQKKGQRWRDRRLGDVPVDFLSDCDTTGGNSGSPTIDAQGRLVGVNFDRVWENVANDFGYNPAIARNVNADARYLLWLLDEVEGAGWLLKEMGAAK
jgi:Peptidase S46